MNLLTDQSPDYHPEDEKRGSTASLPQLEGGHHNYMHVKATGSSQSLARLETNSIRSAGSTHSLPQLESSPLSDQLSSPGAIRTSAVVKGKKSRKPNMAQPSQTSYEVAYMLGRLNDMEAMCQRCASKMDIHIGNLQQETLRQDLDHEDEILLSLAGLKQVRDVLKGILKPSNLFEEDPIHIRENHYEEDSKGLSSADITPSSQASYGSPRSAHKGHSLYMGSSVETGETSTSPDSSSPEYINNTRANLSKNKGTNKTRASNGVSHLSHGKEIELKDLQMQRSMMNRDNASRRSNGALPKGSCGNGIHQRKYSLGNLSEFETENEYDANQNSHSVMTQSMYVEKSALESIYT